MSIDTKTTATSSNRTWQITIHTPRDGNYSVTVNREIVVKTEDGTIITATPLIAEVTRQYKDIAGMSITIDKVSMTISQLLPFLAGFADMLASEDIEIAKKAEKPA